MDTENKPAILPGAEPVQDEARQAAEAINSQIPEELKAQAAAIPRPVGIKFTIDGEVVVFGRVHPEDPKKMQLYDMPLPVVEAAILPPNWQDRHDFIMGVVYEACSQIRSMKGRQVPLTRNELIEFMVTKDEIAKLAKWEFLGENTIKVQRSAEDKGQMVAIVYFTPKGRAYVRKNIDPSYALPVNREGKPINIGAKDGSEPHGTADAGSGRGESDQVAAGDNTAVQ